MHRLALCLWTLCLTLACGGCVTVVQPPTRVSQPTTIWLVDYGLHSSLLLPVQRDADPNTSTSTSTSDPATPRVTHAEYAFGDWGWYARGDTGPFQAVRSLLFSDASTLCRVEYHWPHNPGPRTMTHLLGAQHVHPLQVDTPGVQTLRRRLEHIIQQNHERQLIRGHALFVPVPERYWVGHTCNAWTADRLRELGCHVRGPTLRSEFVIKVAP